MVSWAPGAKAIITLATEKNGKTCITSATKNPATAIDYAYRAVHLTAATAKKIADAYYGSKVARAYWNSCSNGGRQGLIEAQLNSNITYNAGTVLVRIASCCSLYNVAR